MECYATPWPLLRDSRIFMAKLTILCYNQIRTYLQSNGMAAIPKSLSLPLLAMLSLLGYLMFEYAIQLNIMFKSLFV